MKRREVRKQATVDKILSAALRTFAEFGFEGARIDNIADRAGVNKAMIYYHIGDKQVLYARVLHDVFSDTANRLVDSVSRAQTPVTKLKAYIRAMATTFTRHPLLPPIMMREFASGGQNLPDDAATEMLRILNTVTDLLLQGQKQKKFIRIHPLVLHLMVVGTLSYLHSTRPARMRLSAATGKKDLAPDRRDAATLLGDVEKMVMGAITKQPM